jgi:hypothetical protein
MGVLVSIRFYGQPLFSFKSTNIAFSVDVNRYAYFMIVSF